MPNIYQLVQTDDISPMTVGDTYPIWTPTLVDASGNAINLTSLSSASLITLNMRNEATGATKVGQGTVTITSASAGQISYAWATADTNTAGEWLCRFDINWDSNAPQQSDVSVIVFNQAL